MKNTERSSYFDNEHYSTLIEQIEVLVVTKKLMGIKTEFKITETENVAQVIFDYLGVSPIGAMYDGVLLSFSKKYNHTKVNIKFYSEGYKAAGLKGNLKNEGFIYSSRNFSGHVEYKFDIHDRDPKIVSWKIKRLLKLFKNYI